MKLKIKIQENEDNLKEVFEKAFNRTKEIFEDIIGDLIANIVSRYEDNLNITCLRYLQELRPFFNYRCYHEVNYYKNGQHIGNFYQQTTENLWGESHGIFGENPGCERKGFGCLLGRFPLDYEGCWKTTCKDRFQKDLNTTIEAIKKRAMLLFNFETNPESILQKLYKESSQTNSKVLQFPSKEMDNLIRQCNEFIKNAI